MGALVFCQHKKKIVLFLKCLHYRGLILSAAKSAVVLLELISHRIDLGEDNDRHFLTKERRQGRRQHGVQGSGLP